VTEETPKLVLCECCGRCVDKSTAWENLDDVGYWYECEECAQAQDHFESLLELDTLDDEEDEA
jgi:hypothetical protein